MQPKYKLLKDDMPLIECTSDFEIMRYIHKHTPQSLSYALQYAGYTILKDGTDVSKEYILK